MCPISRAFAPGFDCYRGAIPLALDPFRFLLISLGGWLNQRQQDVMGYLQEENQVPSERLGGNNDDQRRRLAVSARNWEPYRFPPLPVLRFVEG